MVSFRKALMVVALLALCAGFAAAQSSCLTTGVTSIVRSEGVTELLNPLFVNCTNATATTTGLYTVTLYSTSVAITSVPATDKAASEVILVVNGTPGIGDEIDSITGGTPYAGTVAPNGATVTFNDVSITGGLTTNLGIQGVRINVSTLVQGGPAFASGIGFTLLAQPKNDLGPGGVFGGSPIYNFVNAAYAIPTFSFGVQYPGWTATKAGTEVNIAQCDPKDPNIAQPTADTPTFPTVFTLQFTELFSESFLEQGLEETTGAAFTTNATRLWAKMTNIPANTNLWVPISITIPSAATPPKPFNVQLMNGTKADGSGGKPYVAGDATADADGNLWVMVPAGGVVVYEVTASDPDAVEILNVPVAVSVTGTPGLAPATGGSVSAAYAPVSANPGPSATDPLPRFSMSPKTGSGLYGVAACSTSLLFPYLSTEAGYNVGLAISNTGMDPFGNAGQGGTCAFTFYGAGQASAAPVMLGAAGFNDTTAIVPGSTAADVISNAVSPNAPFRGYAIAVCNFQYAHGYALLIGSTSKNSYASDYLALVLQNKDAKPLQRGQNNGQFEITGQ